MSESPVQVVCDAGPLIHLDELGCLDLLADFWVVLVPEQVWWEVQNRRPSVFEHRSVEFQQLSIVLSKDASLQALIRALALDLGEQAALTLMARHPDAILLTDDAAARLAARGLGYRVHGTIGILLRAIRRQLRTKQEVLVILRGLPTQSSLHIRSELLQGIIAQVEIAIAENE
jgi:predicted nucleic acid-binding protein